MWLLLISSYWSSESQGKNRHLIYIYSQISDEFDGSHPGDRWDRSSHDFLGFFSFSRFQVLGFPTTSRHSKSPSLHGGHLPSNHRPFRGPKGGPFSIGIDRRLEKSDLRRPPIARKSGWCWLRYPNPRDDVDPMMLIPEGQCFLLTLRDDVWCRLDSWNVLMDGHFFHMFRMVWFFSYFQDGLGWWMPVLAAKKGNSKSSADFPTFSG